MSQLEFPFAVQPKVLPVYPHFLHPENDNEWLLEYQYRYRQLKDEIALIRLVDLAKTIALKFINKESRKNKHIRHFALWERQDKAHDAVMYFLERYKKDDSFSVEKNYPGYIYLRVQHELYYQRKVDRIVDFVDLDSFFKLGTDDEPIDDGDRILI